MRTDWMKSGAEYNSTPEQRKRLLRIADKIEWQAITPEGLDMAFAPGEAIKAVIAALKIPKVTHVCDSNELAPFGLVGVRGHFVHAAETKRQGHKVYHRVEFLFVDEGCSTSTLLANVYEPSEGVSICQPESSKT